MKKNILVNNYPDDVELLINAEANPIGDCNQKAAFFADELFKSSGHLYDTIVQDRAIGLERYEKEAANREYGVRFNFKIPVSGDAGKYTRLGSLEEYNDSNGHAHSWNDIKEAFEQAGKTVNDAFPIQAKMRRCVVKDEVDPLNPQNSVVYYLDANDSTLQEDGVTEALLDGTDGQVMVEVPLYYVKVNEIDADTLEWWISPIPREGYVPHPSFYKRIDGEDKLVPFRYDSAYLGVLQDKDGVYQNSYDNIKDDTGEYVDSTELHVKLGAEGYTTTTRSVPIPDNNIGERIGSVSGFLPISNGGLDDFRVAARNRDGNNDDSTWRVRDYLLYSSAALLMVIEYATFNSQLALTGSSSMGLTNTSRANWEATCGGARYPLVPTGATNKLGNRSGNVPLKDLYGENGEGLPMHDGTNKIHWTDVVPSYRGIESPYGHIWQWLDGININRYTEPVEENPRTMIAISLAYGNFKSNTLDHDGYFPLLGVQTKADPGEGDIVGTVSLPDGYPSDIHRDEMPESERGNQALYGFYPSLLGASTTTGFCDYHYTTTSLGHRAILMGGSADHATYAGVFYLNSADASSYRLVHYGSRLCL